jgi:translation initiation factor 2 beta subunit (eIF-2beta)/eIF-5
VTDYPFRLLCKRCNSYRFTTIQQVGNHYIRMKCRRCGNHTVVKEELFENAPEPG